MPTSASRAPGTTIPRTLGVLCLAAQLGEDATGGKAQSRESEELLFLQTNTATASRRWTGPRRPGRDQDEIDRTQRYRVLRPVRSDLPACPSGAACPAFCLPCAAPGQRPRMVLSRALAADAARRRFRLLSEPGRRLDMGSSVAPSAIRAGACRTAQEGSAGDGHDAAVPGW